MMNSTWHPKQPCFNGCLAISNHFPKVWNHPTETTIYKWLALGFQIYIYITLVLSVDLWDFVLHGKDLLAALVIQEMFLVPGKKSNEDLCF